MYLSNSHSLKKKTTTFSLLLLFSPLLGYCIKCLEPISFINATKQLSVTKNERWRSATGFIISLYFFQFLVILFYLLVRFSFFGALMISGSGGGYIYDIICWNVNCLLSQCAKDQTEKVCLFHFVSVNSVALINRSNFYMAL